MMLWLWVLIGVLAVFLVIAIVYLNRIIILSNRIKNAWSQINVQLKKRTDLVPNLVETVKGYAKHEKKIFEEVADARARMVSATGVDEKMKAGNELGKALKSIFAIAENYPKLQANENFKLLQEQLEGIENKVAYARQFYNDSVLTYNNMVTTFPGVMFAAVIGKRSEPFFEIAESERKAVKVKFD